MKLIVFLIWLLPIPIFAQWNYDNQNVIYSTNGNVGIGIGSDTPIANLQIGKSTENGLLNLGGYSFIGSLRSSGDFFAGRNAFAEYTTSEENSKIKVYSTSSYGFSAMHMTYTGEINFYVKGGSVTANQQINVPAFNAMKISAGGFVGIGTTDPQGYLHVNPIRPVIIKNNGGYGVYGSEIGFNSILDTSAPQNKFKKLGGTSQRGGANIAVDYYGNMFFQMYDGGSESESITDYNPQLVFKNNGSVGIGTTDPGSFKLAVEGKVGASEVVVSLQRPWPDYVFEASYDLPSLSDLEQYVKTNKHLPDVPTAADIKENGLSVGEMNTILLKKVEELSLHLIQMNKRIERMEVENNSQRAEIEKLKCE